MEYPDALNLLAAIVEQARVDSRPHIYYDSKCVIDLPHSPRKCAREFLATLDMKLNEGKPMTIEDLALTVTEVIE